MLRGGWWLGAVMWTSGCSGHPVVDLVSAPAEPGLPVAVAPLTVSPAPGYVVDCLGTLVHPHWVLSAAHCFSESSPTSWILIREFGASAQVRDVILHPEAVGLSDVEPGAYSNEDIVAAHDLALIPLKYGVDDERVAQVWRPGDQGDRDLSGSEAVYGRHAAGQLVTERAVLEGLVPASRLLSDSQSGELLSASGPAPQGGDSGGGAFWASEVTPLMLVGVVQNAPPNAERGSFGLVPMWLPEHLEFLEREAVDPPG